MKFSTLNLKEEILKAIEDLNYVEMTPIQEKSIPVTLTGVDVFGQAQTGTGKTASFAIPIIQNTNIKNKGVETLVLAPTRELAEQIEEDFKRLSKYLDIKVATLIGGVRYDTQIRQLASKPHIIIATPGRAVDMLNKSKLSLEHLKHFVLDEADEMLKVGFKEEIDHIISCLPENSQRLLFSATSSEQTERIKKTLLKNEEVISVSSGLATTKNIKQEAIITREGDKLKVLTRILDINKDSFFIIFCRTKRRSDELSLALNELNYSARALHGDLVQQQRTQIIKEIKSSVFNILVCTDVAARGLDIEGVEFVVNFDLPQEIEYYVHRIGRCGRAGKKGNSISFVRENEQFHLERIMKETKSEIEYVPQPSKREVKRTLASNAKEKIKNKINQNDSIYAYIAEDLLEEYNATQIIAALIDMQITKVDKPIPVLTPEPPVSQKGFKKSRSSNRGNGSRDGRQNRSGFSNKDSKGNFKKRSDNKPKQGDFKNRNHRKKQNRSSN